MVIRGGGGVGPRGRTSGRRRHEDGSALVAAIALTVVLGILAASVTARTVGALVGVSAEHDRVVARTIAEDVLLATIRSLDAPALRAERFAQGGRAPLPDPVPVTTDEPASVQVVLAEEGRGIDVRVDVVLRDASATARARLRPLSTTDLVWLTESSARDPLLEGSPRITCSWPADDPRRHPACADMVLAADVVDGPAHSNDGSVLGPATSYLSTVTASRQLGSPHRFRSEVSLPRDVHAVLGPLPPACRFRGPTLIRFDGTSIRVTSPRSVPRPDDPVDGPEVIGCLGVDRDALAGVVAIDLPPEVVIEIVRDTTDQCVEHPLGLDPASDLEREWQCDDGDAFVWGRYRGARTVIAHDSIQIVWDLAPGDASGPDGGDTSGVLGLVAGDSVVLRRPVGPDPVTLIDDVLPFAGANVPPFGAFPLDAPNVVPTTWEDPDIVAAIVALRGSFAPMNVGHGRSPHGEIVLVGSIASRFAPALQWDLVDRRGRIVGSREFPVRLAYDTRLDRSPPPAMPMIAAGRLRIVELEVG